MAKNNAQTGESPEETGANGEINTQANIQAGDDAAKARAEAEAQAEAEAEARAKEEAEAKAKAEAKAAKAETKPETVPVQIRHKTPYPKYRCAGLLLTQKPETCQVTKAQLERLRRDPWVVIEQENAPQ